jgi:MinD-like ATPase involved in chromosome partitioning or flagellar assembly
VSGDPVLVLLGPTDWEGQFVAGLAHPASRLSVARRCLDTADLLAAAHAGIGRAVVLGADSVRLDADVVDRVRAAAGMVVGVVTAGDESAARRLRHWGVDVVVHVDAADVGAAVREVARAVEHSSLVAVPTFDVTAAATVGDGRIVTVWGPSGAPGRTSVAIALADEAARDGVRTLLVDADTWAPSVSAVLGIVDDGAGLASACRRALAGSLDGVSLAALCRELRDDLLVLPGIPRAGRWTEVRAAALTDVLEVARGLAQLIVVDCAAPIESDEELVYDTEAPRRNAATFTALDKADAVVVVGTCTPHDTIRLVTGLSDLRAHSRDVERYVVVTRVRESLLGRRPSAAIAEALHRHAGVDHVWCVPDDPAAYDEALLTGRTLADVAPGSAARRMLRGLTRELVRTLELPQSVQATTLRAR